MRCIYRLLNYTTLILLVCICSAQGSRENLRLLAGAARQAARGDTATALQVIERFLAQPGRNEAKPEALYLKGILETARGRTDTAETVLRELVVQYPGAGRIGLALTQLGLLANRQGRDTAAVRILEPVAGHFPDSAFTQAALLILARSAGRAGLPEKALKAYLQFLLSRDSSRENLAEALHRCANLLYNTGRVEEAYALVDRIKQESELETRELNLGTQILAIGCLTGLGKPDSSLRLAEEIRRTSGHGPLGSPRLVFLLGHAYLALGALASADSAFKSLASMSNLEAEGIASDSLYHLLMEISLEQGKNENFFRYAKDRIKALEEPRKAVEVLSLIADVGKKLGRQEPVSEALRLVKDRFSQSEYNWLVSLIEARAAAASGDKQAALKILADLSYTLKEPDAQARIKLARCNLFLECGDILRAEAELRDYLATQGDPLHNKDSLLWAYSGLKSGAGEVSQESELLETLIRDYPASSFWEQASRRLEEIEMFESENPARAAGELFDILKQQGGQISALRLAELAARQLDDYERALSILLQNPPQAPEERLKLIRYRFLSGLKLKRRGSVEATERIAQSWREIRYLLAREKSFPGREEALSTYLNIYQSVFNILSLNQIREADNQLRAELAGLGEGPVRAKLLQWLGGRYLSAAQSDSGFAAIAKEDSARACWTEAIDIGGDLELTGRTILSLARSLEDAVFAGARDSAASLYGVLITRYPGSRWASLAGLRLGIIHLRQDRYSLAYRTISGWFTRHPYVADNPEYCVALAETSFFTGRYARAASILENVDLDDLQPVQRPVIANYRIRALTKLGRFGEASRLLLRFKDSFTDETSRLAAAATAVELYRASGSPRLAEKYLETIPESSEFYPVAAIFSLRGKLVAGEDPERLRKEFDRLKKSPWNAFFRMDPAFGAHRGMMACYAAEGEPKKVSDVRDNFRKSYPERRAALAELMMDEIEMLIGTGSLKQAATFYDDLNLLFQDVYPEDRAMWVGHELARVRSNIAGSNKILTALAEKFPWSPYGVRAKLRMARLYLEAGQIEQAESMLIEMKVGLVDPFAAEGLQASIAGTQGRWKDALRHRKRQWSLTPVGEQAGELLLGWAEAAIKTNRGDEAMELLTGFWSPEPQVTAEARYMLALEYRKAGNLDLALETLDTISELFAGRNELALKALYQKGLIQEEMGQREEAVKTYQALEKRAGEKSDWVRSARNRLRKLVRNNGNGATGSQP